MDAAAAEAIRQYEARHAPAAPHRIALFAFAFGGLLLGAGVLLFVASHWNDLAPSQRFALVLALVGALHAGGALVGRRSVALATTLHAAGTAALGAGILRSAQIFNLAEHWPAGLMLWALGAAIGLVLLRDCPHTAWTAVLVPAWLLSEWIERLATHALHATASVGLVLWGLSERESLRVNVGVVDFALTVLALYFGSLFDMLGRSVGLIGAGALFIGGGLVLERTRRRLVGRIAGEPL